MIMQEQYKYIHNTVVLSDTCGAQNQYDVEMDIQVRNEYAEVGPQIFNSEGQEVTDAVGNPEVCTCEWPQIKIA